MYIILFALNSKQGGKKKKKKGYFMESGVIIVLWIRVKELTCLQVLVSTANLATVESLRTYLFSFFLAVQLGGGPSYFFKDGYDSNLSVYAL